MVSAGVVSQALPASKVRGLLQGVRDAGQLSTCSQPGSRVVRSQTSPSPSDPGGLVRLDTTGSVVRPRRQRVAVGRDLARRHPPNRIRSRWFGFETQGSCTHGHPRIAVAVLLTGIACAGSCPQPRAAVPVVSMISRGESRQRIGEAWRGLAADQGSVRIDSKRPAVPQRAVELWFRARLRSPPCDLWETARSRWRVRRPPGTRPCTFPDSELEA